MRGLERADDAADDGSEGKVADEGVDDVVLLVGAWKENGESYPTGDVGSSPPPAVTAGAGAEYSPKDL